METNIINWKKNTIKFMSAQTISLLGSSLVQYAIVWYITLTTSSGLMMTVSTVCGFLPQICISLFAGVWIDKYDRKKMIMLADTMIASATLVLAILFFMGQKSIWLLFAVLLVRSAGAGIQTPAVSAIIPQIVPREHLMRVSGINSTLNSIMTFLSPALSGMILSVYTVETTMLIDVVTAVIGIGIMFFVNVPMHSVDKISKHTHIEDIKAGFAYLKSNRAIKNLIVFIIVTAVLISPAAFLTPLMVSRFFGAEVWRLTLSEMTFSAGAVIGGILIATWGGFKNRMRTTLTATAIYGTLMLALGLAHTFFLYLCANTLIGITMPCYSSPITVYIQEKTPEHMHGRVFSLVQVANSCALPMGMVLFGPLSDVINVKYILLAAGCAVILLTLCTALKGSLTHE